MTMGKLYKQFEEWVIKWEISTRIDEFFEARFGLTLYYLLTAIIILGGSSYITYKAILANLTDSIMNSNINFGVSQQILSNAQSILLNRFLTIDSLIILSTVIIGFLLTDKTLKPIKSNMLKQKRFIADASHELRTPITVIISGLEVTLNNKKLDFPMAKKALEETLAEMQDFTELSNNLLDISKYDISSLGLKQEHIRIDDKIKRITEKSAIVAKRKHITIETEIESPATISGNRVELNRVFYNILDNAIKYTPQGGKIKILGEIKSKKYFITISDTGTGIQGEDIEKIFDPFFRTSSARSTNTKGAGLGLTLSKKIIENHEGTIQITSKANLGTNIIVSLPLLSS